MYEGVFEEIVGSPRTAHDNVRALNMSFLRELNAELGIGAFGTRGDLVTINGDAAADDFDSIIVQCALSERSLNPCVFITYRADVQSETRTPNIYLARCQKSICENKS